MPTGATYSVKYNGSVEKGTTPYAKGYANPNHACRELWVHKVCPVSHTTQYTVALVLMPAGKPLRIKDAVALDWTTVTVAG